MFITSRLRNFVQNKSGSKMANALIASMRQVIQQKDKYLYNIWEFTSTRMQRLPSDGYMLSILKRMGLQSFSEYIIWQKLHQHDRSFIPMDRQETVNQLNENHPEAAAQIIVQANALCDGIFDLLGSAPVDMRRSQRSPGYRIDWCKDPITGLKYKRFFDFRRWAQPNVRQGQPDIKGCWELGRFQHFATLGQAYWITGDQKYADHFAHSISDFIKRNPPGVGVQWACPMDVGLRVVSWIIGLQFFQGNKALSYRWWKRFLKSLVTHGEYIASNLEFGTLGHDIITSNHYLSDVFGLYWLALAFPNIDVSCVWRGLAERALEHEIQFQTHPDGGNFESSIPYHMLVSEIYLSAYSMSLKHNIPLSDQYRDRLLKALRLLKATRQPDGRQPQVGDADMGRAHILTHYGNFTQENADYILAAGAKVLNCPELASDIPACAQIEALFWNHSQPKQTSIEAVNNPCILPHSGLGIIRQVKHYVMLCNTPAGTLGISNHKHNDHLSIEYVYDGDPIFVDPGSYTYTMDPDMRNQFRSTAMHNTLQIEKHEQNRFDPALLFKMETDAAVTLVTDNDNLVGTHSGYCRLHDSYLHQRRIQLVSNGQMIIEDKIESDHVINCKIRFMLHPSNSASLSDNHIIINSTSNTLLLKNENVNKWAIESSYYSPNYGKRTETQCITGSLALNKVSVTEVSALLRE